MLPDDVTRRGQQMLTICNACRYCEQFCPVFPAIEQRRTFGAADLTYLANLCHNCGECLYACQFAPPHEFGVNVPSMLADIRTRSYEEFAWPPALGQAFRRHGYRAGLMVFAVTVSVLVLVSLSRGDAIWPSDGSADFYGVIPHDVMVTLFGTVSAFVGLALAISGTRFWRECGPTQAVAGGSLRLAGRDALTLKHLHGNGLDCSSSLETRTPWRRWFHHLTVYGMALCVASTTVAAIYHGVFGWIAPYGYTSVPVLLGSAGGIGLLVGPAGLALLRRNTDPSLSDEATRGLDGSFLLLLFLTSLTGMALLVLRHSAAMGLLLIVHLSAVLALFLTLPYGKFVHGIYRVLALVRYHAESIRSGS